MKFPVIGPAGRSGLLAIIGGMMAASYLHDRDIVDLGFGFPRGSLPEGALMALAGGLAGYALLAVFRVVRGLTNHDKGP